MVGLRKSSRFLVLVLSLVMVLVAASCGDDDATGEGDGGGEGVTGVTGATGDEGGGEEEMPEVTISALSGGLTAVAASIIDENNFDEANGWVGTFEFRDPDSSGQFFLQRNSDIAFDFDAIGAAIAREQGLNVTVFYPILNNNNCILTNPGSGYSSPEDLIGERVGHFGADSGTTTSFTIVLNEYFGFNLLEDYRLAETDPASLVEFLANGEVEAIFDFVPHSSRAIAGNGAECMFGPLSEELDELSGGSVISHLSAMAAYDDYIAENPDTVRSVMAAWDDAFEWITEDPTRITQEPYVTLLAQDDPAVLELIADQVTSIPLFTNDWSAEVQAGVEAWVDLAAEQGVLIESNPGGVITNVG